MATSRTAGSLRGSLAATVRHHPDADTTQLRTELATARIAEYVKKVTASAPPLDQSQKDRLATLLRGGGA